MTPPAVIFVLAASVVFAVAAVAVSLFAVWRSRAVGVMMDERSRAGLEECRMRTEAVRKMADEFAAQLRDLQSAAPGMASAVKPGLNLTNRSQALRMHRNGDPPQRIAAALAVPLQEVDLLLKVNRIVLKSI